MSKQVGWRDVETVLGIMLADGRCLIAAIAIKIERCKQIGNTFSIVQYSMTGYLCIYEISDVGQ